MVNAFKSNLKRRFVKYRRDDDGATMVETAIALPIFLVVVFGILQWAWIFAMYAMLDFSHEDAARLVQTGQASGGAVTMNDYKQVVCDQNPLLDCDRLKVIVDSYDDFSSVPTFRRGDGTPRFNPGEGGDVIVARLHYSLPVITNISLLGMNPFVFSTGSSRVQWVISMRVFRNEFF